jgi:hypothetical protein
MSRLADRQHAFSMALLDCALSAPSGLLGPDGAPCPQRFAVYRNNVVFSLVEALRDSFPATGRIVGGEFFTSLARAYVLAHPPCSPILLQYGKGFPDFIARFAAAAPLPYLPDVARIEWAWIEAYHAVDAAPLGAAAFDGVENDRLARISLTTHPSLRIVRSSFPALTIWRMNVGDGLPMAVDLAAGGEDALIIRPVADVEVRCMPLGGAEFIRALADGRSVVEATALAIAADQCFDLSANLAELVDAGAFVGYAFAHA